jgi:hypothetical protein
MSLAASTRRAYAVDAQARSSEFRKASTETDVETALEKITQWIPSEVVAAYVALLGIFAPDDSTLRWVLFAVGVVLVIVFVGLNAALVNKRGREKWESEKRPGPAPKLATKRLLTLMGVGIVAFVVWAFALPDSPFLSVTEQATRIGGALVVIVSLVMPLVAELLDLKIK